MASYLFGQVKKNYNFQIQLYNLLESPSNYLSYNLKSVSSIVLQTFIISHIWMFVNY